MLGVVGSLSLDYVDGRPPRPGGAIFYAAQALRLLGRPAAILAKCAPNDRVDLGVDAEWLPAEATTAFSYSYDGDARTISVERVGDPWTTGDVEGRLGEVEWLHVGGLLRSDFPAETLAALAGSRVLSLDAQALVRPAREGAIRTDSGFDPAVLEHVHIVSLSEEEAAVLPVERLPVPEVILTLASRGSIVYADGDEHRIEIEPVLGVDPTGSGDAFAVAYLAARADGRDPVDAAERASALVYELLRRR